jgi:hypothetical protein
MYRLKLALAAIIGLLSVPLAALPPEPGTTRESDEASELIDKIVIHNMVYSGDNKPEGDRLRTELFQKLEAGCRKNDAWACAQITNLDNFYKRYPEPRIARQGFAEKAGSLYLQFCEANLKTKSCLKAREFLEAVAKEDNANPPYRTDGLGALWLQFGRTAARACDVPDLPSEGVSDEAYEAASDAQFDAGEFYAPGNCEDALKALDRFAVTEAKAFREVLCARDKEDACRALGRLSASQQKQDGVHAAACDSGDGNSCMMIAARWMYRTDLPNFGAETRKWAAKSCAANFTMGCMGYAQANIDPKYGAVDYPKAADAFGAACRLTPGKGGEAACKNEKIIRDALAAAKAKAAAKPAN